MEAECVGEQETADAVRTRKHSGDMRTVDRLQGLCGCGMAETLLVARMRRHLVVKSVPSKSKWVKRRDDETKRATRKRLHLYRPVERGFLHLGD